MVRRLAKLCLRYAINVTFVFFVAFSFLYLLLYAFVSEWSVSLVPKMGYHVDTRNFITTFSSTRAMASREKLIMMWTNSLAVEDWGFSRRSLENCRHTNCSVTTDKRRLEESDAILFDTRRIDHKTLLPPTRTPNQVWVLHNSEPPYYIFLDWKRYNGVFNWTSWYRKDATVYSPYGNYKRKAPEPEDDEINVFASKNNFSFWAASSCTDRIRRYRLIRELKKFIDIHTYGHCGTISCPKWSSACEDIFKEYKFVFAIENGLCRDYITEKFWKALDRKQIPVVWGGADYTQFAPPGSYIDIKDFSSTEKLAEYLIRLGQNETAYNEFFAWRRGFSLVESQVVGWCQLCSKLHDPTMSAQVFSDLEGWVKSDSCETYSVSVGLFTRPKLTLYTQTLKPLLKDILSCGTFCLVIPKININLLFVQYLYPDKTPGKYKGRKKSEIRQ